MGVHKLTLVLIPVCSSNVTCRAMTLCDRLLDAPVGSMGNLYHSRPLPEVVELLNADGSNREQVRHLPGHRAFTPEPMGSLSDRIHLAVRRDRARLQWHWMHMVMYMNMAFLITKLIPSNHPLVVFFLFINLLSVAEVTIAAAGATFWREALTDVVQCACSCSALTLLILMPVMQSFRHFGVAEYWCVFQALVTIPVCLSQMLFLGFITRACRGRRATSVFIFYSEDYKNEICLMYLGELQEHGNALGRGLPDWERYTIIAPLQDQAGEPDKCSVCMEVALEDMPLHALLCPRCRAVTCIVCVNQITRHPLQRQGCPVCRYSFWRREARGGPRVDEHAILVGES